MSLVNRCSTFALCCVLAGMIVAGSGCGKKQTRKAGRREVRVTLGAMQKRVFRRTIPVQGTVYPIEYATISAKISGTLELLKVDEGDVLKKGEVLFGIDRQVLKNQVTVREAEIKVKKAELESAKVALSSAEISRRKAELDYERFLRLWRSKATSQAEFEVYETAYKKAQLDVKSANAAILNADAQLKQAISNLTIAKKNLNDSVISAPFDCIVTDRYIEENEYVSSGQDILKLENHQELEIICYISSVYYNEINPGKTKVDIFSDGVKCGTATVSIKAPSIDPESRTFKLKITVPKSVKIVSGTLCDLTIVLEEKDAYGLPADSLLLRANDRHIVYAIDKDNRAKSIEVKRGIVDGRYCEVLDGVKLVNEKFIITGQTFVNNGAAVTVINN